MCSPGACFHNFWRSRFFRNVLCSSVYYSCLQSYTCLITTHLSGQGIGFGSSLYRFPYFQGINTNINLIWKDSCMNLFAFGSYRFGSLLYHFTALGAPWNNSSGAIAFGCFWEFTTSFFMPPKAIPNAGAHALTLLHVFHMLFVSLDKNEVNLLSPLLYCFAGPKLPGISRKNVSATCPAMTCKRTAALMPNHNLWCTWKLSPPTGALSLELFSTPAY